MARQNGIIRLKGTIGGISFYKSQDGHMAREKGGIEADRIKNDPAFQRTRENGEEFGSAGKAGKLLRTAIRQLLQNAKDRRVVSRLTTQMVDVLQADRTNPRGKRNVVDGNLLMLKDFNFNLRAKLGSMLFVPYTAAINRVAGTIVFNFPAFVPSVGIEAPGGTTHFKIVTAGSEVDFLNDSYITDRQESAILPWDNTPTQVLTLTNNVTANSAQALFAFVGIQFFQLVNNTMYPLKNGNFNPLNVVEVDI